MLKIISIDFKHFSFFLIYSIYHLKLIFKTSVK